MVLTGAGACDSIAARFDSYADVYLDADLCPAAMLAVGERAQMHAVLEAKKFGSSHVTESYRKYFDSRTHPDRFEWKLSYPLPRDYRSSARGEISKSGLLSATGAGTLFVEATSAGKTSAPFEVTVGPRVTRFAISPRDTSLNRGDTVLLRMDLGLDGSLPRNWPFRWNLPSMNVDTQLVSHVARDPWVQRRTPFAPVPPPSPFELHLVAERPGTLQFVPCAGGTWRDSVTIRIAGRDGPPDRNVAPVIELYPAETTMYAGATFSNLFRIRNATLGNGPYRWRLTMGDGGVIADSTQSNHRARSPFEFERGLANDYRYRTAGRFPLELTVTDSAGRSTTLRTVYVMRELVFRMVLYRADTSVPPRLRDDTTHLAIAILSAPGGLDATQIEFKAPPHVDSVPPLMFGKTVYASSYAGRSTFQIVDADGDGTDDKVVWVEKKALIANGDLRVGRNRLVMTGALRRPPTIVPGTYVRRPLYIPIRGVLEFNALP